MKRFATDEDKAIVAIPPVVRIVPIRVEIALAIIVVHLENMRVAVRNMYKMPSVPPPPDYSKG